MLYHVSVSEEWPASDAATSQYATVLATTYYTPFGIGKLDVCLICYFIKRCHLA